MRSTLYSALRELNSEEYRAEVEKKVGTDGYYPYMVGTLRAQIEMALDKEWYLKV